MRRPRQVKILGFNYKIVGLTPSQVMGFGAEGLHMADELEIGIGDHLPPIRQVQVFLHESLHAITYSMGLRGEALDEETVVEKLSDGLIAMWRDNPYAMSWCNHVIQAEEEAWLEDQLAGDDEDDEDEPEPQVQQIRRRVSIRRSA
jgi:hypothetical protein